MAIKGEEELQKKQKVIIGIVIGSVIFVVVGIMCVLLLLPKGKAAQNTEIGTTNPPAVSTGAGDDIKAPTEPEGVTETPTDSEPEVPSELPHEHVYTESVTKAANCTEDGEKRFDCECGESYTEVIVATGHIYGEYVYNNDATYAADGTQTATCACGAKDTIAAPGTKRVCTYTDMNGTMWAISGVNVRDLPSTDGNIIGALTEEQEVTITGKCNETGWYRIIYNGNVGYVSHNYLTTERPKTEEELKAQQQEYINMVLATDEVKKMLEAVQNDIATMEAEYQNFVTMSAADPENALLSNGVTEIAGYLAQAKEIAQYDYMNLEASKGLDPKDEDDAKILAKPYSYNYVRRMLSYNISWMKSQVNQLLVRTSLVKSTENEWYGQDINTVPENRKALVAVAESLLGKIAYEWGGKPHYAGWNKVWDKEGEGLDCSGFIEWVYWTYTGTRNANLHSTISIVSTQQQISYDQLKVGDLGLISTIHTRYADYSGKVHGSYNSALKANQAVGLGEDEVRTISNHVGIYVGKDCAGRDLWLHCTSGAIKTVAVTSGNTFSYFYRMPGMGN